MKGYAGPTDCEIIDDYAERIRQGVRYQFTSGGYGGGRTGTWHRIGGDLVTKEIYTEVKELQERKEKQDNMQSNLNQKELTSTTPPSPAETPTPNHSEIEATLSERGARYGSYEEHARVSQSIKRAMQDSNNWADLPDHTKETFEMLAHKIARTLTGDPSYTDNIHDIQGYAKLEEDILLRKQGERADA